MSRLDDFVAAAKRRVAAGEYALTGNALAPGPNFVAALDRPDAVIAELKPRSPSQGQLLRTSPNKILAAYITGGAAAISILTDGDHFGGSPELLRLGALTGKAILMKDFIVSQEQIDNAAHNGASAILLIERVLRAEERERLVEHAHTRGLQVLLEIFDQDDWATAASSKADMIGINARNLETLELDMDLQLSLIQQIGKFPRPVIALSGIRNRLDRQRARRAGAAAVLVGTSLMRHIDPAMALTGIRRVLVKVCGIRRAQDVLAATAAGADLIGFVTGAPKSPRNLSIQDVRRLAELVHHSGAKSVMVTPESNHDKIVEWATFAHVHIAQVHANIDGLQDRLHSHGIALFAAIAPLEPMPVHADGVVLDAAPEGGSGRHHDWESAAHRAQTDTTMISLIAGGIQPFEAGSAIMDSMCWGVDASGGLEGLTGFKDARLINEYVRHARRARP